MGTRTLRARVCECRWWRTPRSNACTTRSNPFIECAYARQRYSQSAPQYGGSDIHKYRDSSLTTHMLSPTTNVSAHLPEQHSKPRSSHTHCLCPELKPSPSTPSPRTHTRSQPHIHTITHKQITTYTHHPRSPFDIPVAQRPRDIELFLLDHICKASSALHPPQLHITQKGFSGAEGDKCAKGRDK